MGQDILEQLRALDPRVLTEIVRQDQRNPAFELTGWTVERLSGKGIINPDGLFRFSGQGGAGLAANPWCLVLKILQQPKEDHDPRDIWYWKREALAAQHHLLERLPGPVAAPRIYAVDERGDNAWIWMEYVGGATAHPWTQGQYAFAAHEIGRLNGAALAKPWQPDYPWLCTEHARWWVATWERLQPDRGRDSRLVRQAFSAPIRARVERLWDEREVFLSVLNRVPQVCSHFDLQRRNLFIRTRADGSDELVAIDWAMVGRAALGGDLFSLIGSSALLFELEPADLGAVEAVATGAYLAGLHDAGWRGDPDLVRLGYSSWFAIWLGATMPAGTAFWTADAMRDRLLRQFARDQEAIAAGWAALCEVALDRADEARKLLHRLRLE